MHAAKVREALDRLLEFRPDLILVSAGFDAYREDPLTNLLLETDDFYHFGHWLGQTGVPAMAILEGGYSNRLRELAESFLRAWSGRRPQNRIVGDSLPESGPAAVGQWLRLR